MIEINLIQEKIEKCGVKTPEHNPNLYLTSNSSIDFPILKIN